MRLKLASVGLAVLVLVLSVSVAFADKPTPNATPSGGPGKTPPGLVGKTPKDDTAAETKERQDANKGKRRGIFGTIANKASDGFTVTTKQGPVTVTVTASTKFHIPRNKHASLADVAVGDRVTVNGTPSSGGLVAKQVLVTPGKPTTQHRVGEVTAYAEGVSITIKTIKGESETFALTKDAVVKNPKGSGVKVGDMVTVVSRRDPSSDSATASGIVVHPK